MSFSLEQNGGESNKFTLGFKTSVYFSSFECTSMGNNMMKIKNFISKKRPPPPIWAFLGGGAEIKCNLDGKCAGL